MAKVMNFFVESPTVAVARKVGGGDPANVTELGDSPDMLVVSSAYPAYRSLTG